IEVRVWQEDQSPTQIAAGALADRGVRTGRIGTAATAAFTFVDHLRHAAPGCACVSADPITLACRGVRRPDAAVARAQVSARRAETSRRGRIRPRSPAVCELRGKSRAALYK